MQIQFSAGSSQSLVESPNPSPRAGSRAFDSPSAFPSLSAGDHHIAAMAALQVQTASSCNGREAADGGGGGSFSFPWPTLLGFLLLTLNSAAAAVRARGDAAAAAFVGFSYADLVALFVCLRMYERAPAGSAKREPLKVAVWVLTTLLTLAFSYKVAAVTPAPVALLVWLMAFATVAGGFVALFVYKEKK